MVAPGNLYIIAAPSGAGKTSLVKALIECTPGIEVSVSHTTRSPRPSEQNGVDYFFIDHTRFESLIAEQRFLEYARVFDHYYGSSRDAVLTRINAGVDIILEIDWQGARQVRQQWPDCQGIFILPSSLAALQERLEGRNQDSAEVIGRRMNAAVAEMSHYVEFDYLIVNDDFQTALDALRAVFIAQRQRRQHQEACHGELLQGLLSSV